MRCPNCDSVQYIWSPNEKEGDDGNFYNYKCLKCGTLFFEPKTENFKKDKDVLME